MFAEAASTLLPVHLVGSSRHHQCTNSVYNVQYEYMYKYSIVNTYETLARVTCHLSVVIEYRTYIRFLQLVCLVAFAEHLPVGGDLLLDRGLQGAAPGRGRRYVRGLRVPRHDARPVRAAAVAHAAAAGGRAVLPARAAARRPARRACADVSRTADESADADAGAGARLPAHRAAARRAHAAARAATNRRPAAGIRWRRLLHLSTARLFACGVQCTCTYSNIPVQIHVRPYETLLSCHIPSYSSLTLSHIFLLLVYHSFHLTLIESSIEMYFDFNLLFSCLLTICGIVSCT